MNWFLIIGLTILIALPFIASSVIIPILVKRSKHRTTKKKMKSKKHK
ncbi:MAG: hypothetical protein LBV37_01885 [Mycoplasmataceae bacterium]|jgi:membrane protein YdbS with pleckstrin-like domain|nr:hypothetical protein [Mycoplasmataceae bacterium]